MKKLINWFSDRWLLAVSLFLLAFIPLYPKLPVVDIRNTWVYIRAEDFLVVAVLAGWFAAFVQNRITLRTPLTVPVLLFWLAGGIATIHSVLLIVPVVWEIYPNVALLSYLRRIEYMSLFFVAYASVRSKSAIIPVLFTLTMTVLAVSLYGLGQRYFGFPAYLTMNEEFAKGIPLRLSALSRISSTFGGHYDLAAYLVLCLPVVASMVFGVRHILAKVFLFAVFALGVVVLFLTVSRISLFALIVSVGMVLVLQRRRLIFLFIPAAVIGVLLALVFTPTILERFTSTVKDADVLVDARTGAPMGHVTFVGRDYFADKTVHQMFYDTVTDVITQASPSADFVILPEHLPDSVVVLSEPKPTGEDLPSGSGYINLTLSPNIKRIGEFIYEPEQKTATPSSDVYVINGQYLIKKAAAYDLSFTTRLQGEWPNALLAFRRNVLFGSGYGSVSLAVDNSYLRMLAEVGIVGFASFIAIFLVIGMYISTSFSSITSPLVRSAVLGYAAGLAGLGINGVFIDVFEASKVAFVLWLLTGFVLAITGLYSRVHLDIPDKLKQAATSFPAVVVYLALVVLVLWAPLTRGYFIGDDFTWLKWAAHCANTQASGTRCLPDPRTIIGYFTDAGGFFYRPGTKMYFSGMYTAFWLNQTAYHGVSLLLHFVNAVLVYLIGYRVLGRRLFAAGSALLFLVMSGFSEAVFWISASGFLFASMGIMAAFLSYGKWRETGRAVWLWGGMAAFSFALVFHELAVMTPLVFILYERMIVGKPRSLRAMVRHGAYWMLAAPLPVYGVMRLLARSHWLSGDYNFNLLKFPLNAAGNAVGYALLALAGPWGAQVSGVLRMVMRRHAVSLGIVLVLFVVVFILRLRKSGIMPELRGNPGIFGGLFAVASLLPFLGLGNISPRYGYLASVGFSILFVHLLTILYGHIAKSGRAAAAASVAVLACVYVLFHSVAIHSLQQEWHQAGEKVQEFIVSMDNAYLDYWSTSPMEFHFVDVPIRHGSAWVFPVGIPDALWFVFRNPDMRVYSWPTAGEALDAVEYGSPVQKVFVFDGAGRVEEIRKEAPRQP